MADVLFAAGRELISFVIVGGLGLPAGVKPLQQDRSSKLAER